MSATRNQLSDSKRKKATVYVVDGDQSVLSGIRSLLCTIGVGVKCCRSAEEFLDEVDFDAPGCVITEVYLPGMSGLDLQDNLRAQSVDYPVIVMTSNADVPLAVRAMRLGALDFVEKPFVERTLLARVKQALHSFDSCRLAGMQENAKVDPEHNSPI